MRLTLPVKPYLFCLHWFWVASLVAYIVEDVKANYISQMGFYRLMMMSIEWRCVLDSVVHVSAFIYVFSSASFRDKTSQLTRLK